jgi:hypothetical protein
MLQDSAELLIVQMILGIAMLEHELCGQKLGCNREEMQVTAAVLLKVSEDDLLHVLRNGWSAAKMFIL